MTPSQLKAWRLRLGLNQIEASKLLGLPYSTYRQFEDGRIKPHALLAAATSWHESQRRKRHPREIAA